MSAALRIRLMLLAQKNYAGKGADFAGPTDAPHQPRPRRSIGIGDAEYIEADTQGNGETSHLIQDFSLPSAKPAVDFRLPEQKAIRLFAEPVG